MQHVGVAFVSLGEGIDCTSPAGKLQLHILAALAEFERELIVEALKSSRGNMAPAAASLGVTERIMGLRVRHYFRIFDLSNIRKYLNCCAGRVPFFHR